MSDLVGNPEDRVSGVAAHVKYILVQTVHSVIHIFFFTYVFLHKDSILHSVHVTLIFLQDTMFVHVNAYPTFILHLNSKHVAYIGIHFVFLY